MKKTITFILIGLMLNAVFYVSSANGAAVTNNSAKETKIIENLKNELSNIGIGENSLVDVKLNNGTKIKGYLSEINEQDFVIVSKDKTNTRISYDDVRSARGGNRHHRFSCSKAALLGGVLGILLLFLSSSNHNRY